MNKKLYNFLANYQWYFVGVFFYFFFRKYDNKMTVFNNAIFQSWLLLSGLITLYTQFYFYKHKNYKPEYRLGYIILLALITILLFEVYYIT